MFLPSFLPRNCERYMTLVLAQARPFMVHCCNKVAGHTEFV